MPFNDEDRILVKKYVCLKDTLHKMCWKNFLVKLEWKVFRSC